MEQHAIPQQISSYEFKLVGEMTLKQFLKAAAGIIMAILINSTGLIVIVKWPLMLVSAGIGLLLAFVPFEDRPLETWVMAFIKSIYSPTIYTYKKRNDNGWLDLDFTKSNNENKDEAEKPIENKNLFVSVTKDTSEAKNKIIRERMNVKAAVESIKDNINSVKSIKKETKELFDTKITVKEKVETKDEVQVENIPEESVKTNDWRDQKTDLNLKKEKLEATGNAVFGTIPMPDRPDIANIIVGMATNWDGKIIDGVIVEIQDEHGSPTRVIKTNSLGQFKISTPLANGRYLIIAEKEGYIFDRVNVDLAGKIIDPIRIISHN